VGPLLDAETKLAGMFPAWFLCALPVGNAFNARTVKCSDIYGMPKRVNKAFILLHYCLTRRLRLARPLT
jgi:hypothetical protein